MTVPQGKRHSHRPEGTTNAPQNFSALFDLFVSLRSSDVRPSTVSGSLIPTKKSLMSVMGDPIAFDVTNPDLRSVALQALICDHDVPILPSHGVSCYDKAV